jgi:hypothetical protein
MKKEALPALARNDAYPGYLFVHHYLPTAHSEFAHFPECLSFRNYEFYHFGGNDVEYTD